MDSKHKRPAQGRGVDRRTVLGWTAASVGAFVAGAACKSTTESEPQKAPAVVGEADKPETPDMRFGIIALTDCSPIVIAHEKGFFKKYGINATIVKGASWGAIRDSLSNGD